ncbi:MAG TPA: PQQ-dependent dehydrogenase, methanol/ethanol family [Vicinamibacterales bacterium]|nr:PQQ-dependent dehydrogenase, methanol/ethanol family [Vicinamibacterales bacterium]
MKQLMVVTAGVLALGTVIAGQVPYSRIVNAAKEPGSWITYNGAYNGQRHSTLSQINTTNVGQLQPAWVYQVRGDGEVETSPIVADGRMIITEPPTTVTALDPRNGRTLWTYVRPMPSELRLIGFPATNRGVAILDDMVYVGSLDGYLIALDAETGAKRWETKIADNGLGHSVTMAPLALDGKIIVGISGGEAGIRGFVDAYNAKTGARVWRTYTIPAAGEPGVDTWAGESWKNGAGATWLTGSYDPELKLLYWGTGNPGPDWNGDIRKGDNLYTSSVLALDPDTGKMKWHFQYTPHDTHDWDANQIQVLADLEIGGRTRKTLITANRNAFYYVLDRVTGEFLHAAAYAKQTWATGIDAKGRPEAVAGKEPTEEGNLVYPSLQGSTNWPSPSFSPQTGLFYVPVREMGSYYYKTDVEYEAGLPFTGGGERRLADEAWGAVRALDAKTGAKAWDFKLPSPSWSGILSTGGGLVFSGSNEGNFYALDAKSGAALWQFQTGGGVHSNPATFLVEGRQFVSVGSGHAVFAFAIPQGSTATAGR